MQPSNLPDSPLASRALYCNTRFSGLSMTCKQLNKLHKLAYTIEKPCTRQAIKSSSSYGIWSRVMSRTLLFVTLAFAAFFSLPLDVVAAEQRFFASIPALGVTELGGKLIGATHYVAIQLDRLPQPVGPQVQFNEGSRSLGRFKGAAVSEDWKDAARVAVQAAAQAVGEDPRVWRVTLKNASDAYLTDGPSAGAALAVAFLAAFRQVPILPGMVLTGSINLDGRISPVGGIPEKIQGAASSGFSTVLIPSGQTSTSEWDIRSLVENLHVNVIEVGTLGEAFEKMTGRAF